MLKKDVKDNKVINKMTWDKVVKFARDKAVMQYVIIGVALFFLSMLLTAQVKTVSNTEEILKGKRETELSEDLIKLTEKYDDLKKKYDESSKIVEEYQNNASSNSSLIASMKQQIERLSLLAGVTDLKGEGIIITLNDGTSNSDPDQNALVHASDVLAVVNELSAAGAEAISVNGQRIISTSSIRCVGPVIQVNYQKVAAPFEIRAIGNAQYLESAMNIKNGVADDLKKYGVEVNISRNSNIKVPKFDGVLTFENSQKDE